MKLMTTTSVPSSAESMIQADEETANLRFKTIEPRRHRTIRIIAITGDAAAPTYTVPVRVSMDKMDKSAGSVVSSSPHQPGRPATISTASANSGTPERSLRAHGTVAVAEVVAEGGRRR